MAETKERRRHPRVELLAQVQVSRASEVHLMPARDISRGGVFLQGEPSKHPDLMVGQAVELLIFVADNIGEDLACSGKIVRSEPGALPRRPAGFGLVFQDLTAAATARLDALLKSARGQLPAPEKKRGPPAPPASRKQQ